MTADMIEAGNIDLTRRPRVTNADGSVSTVRSMGVNIDGQEVLLPTVSEDGRIMGDTEAIAQYKKTGKHLGKFSSVDASNRYAEQLHLAQEAMYAPPKQPGLVGLYSDGIEGNIQRQLRNPGKAPEPSFSLWSAIGAGFKGIPGGGLEAAGSSADLLSVFGTTLAATGGSASGMFGSSTADEQRQAAEASKKLRESNALDPTAGNTLRRRADEFAPDPATAHRADQVLHGLGRFGAKAVGAIGTMGPVGAIPLGLEEGNTTYQRALTEGIDSDTALKLGAVQGTISAVGAVLPMGAATKVGTAGLVAVGGPGAFIAQETLAKNILQTAGYSDQASLHDPYDPLGLTISALLPLAFGGLHMRGVAKRAGAVESGGVSLQQMTPTERQGLKYGDARLDDYALQAAETHGVPPSLLLAIKNAGEKSNSEQTSPKGAQGVMQFMPATAKEMGIADARDPMQSIDGAAKYLRKLYDAYGSWDAAVAHYNGGGAQAAIVRGGGKPTFPETAAYLERVQKYAAEHAGETGAKVPEAVDAARVKVTDDALQRSLPEHPEAQSEVMRASDEIAAGRVPIVEPAPMVDAFPERAPITGRDLVGKSYDELDAMHSQAIEANKAVSIEGIRRFFGEEQATQASGWSMRKIDAWLNKNETAEASDWMQARYINEDLIKEHRNAVNDFDPESPEALGRSIAVSSRKVDDPGFFESPEGATFANALRYAKEQGWDMNKVMDGMRSRSAEWAGDNAPELFARLYKQATEAPPERVALPQLQPQRAAISAPEVEGTNTLPPERAVTIEPTAAKAAEPPSLDAQRVKSIAETSPDLMVKLPGSDETLSVATALTRAEEEAKFEKTESDLIKAAVQCALSFGG